MSNIMKDQVFSCPTLLKQQYEDLEPKTRKVLTTPEIFSVQRIILTGCGDSLAAAMGTKHAFEMLTNIPTEVVPAVELARLYQGKQIGFAPLNPLVITVSNSGGVARLVESIKRVNELGGFTLSVTGNPASPVGLESKRVLELDIPDFPSCPGVRSYMVSVLALLLIAIRIGEVRGVNTMDVSMDMRYDILAQAESLEKMLPEMDSQIAKIASSWKSFKCFDFVGAGFDYATAWYGHAKILEATGLAAMHINSEEWLHLNFFMRDRENIGTFLVANTTNPVHSRNAEVLKYMNELGRPLVVISDGKNADFDQDAQFITVPSTKYPITMPLTQFIPLALFAGYLQVEINEEDGRGCKGAWSFAQGGAAVKNSKIIV